LGPKGNVEFLVWLQQAQAESAAHSADVAALVESVMQSNERPV
jgi:hypothetical protein